MKGSRANGVLKGYIYLAFLKGNGVTVLLSTTKLIFKTIKTITVEQESNKHIIGTSTSYHENKRQFRMCRQKAGKEILQYLSFIINFEKIISIVLRTRMTDSSFDKHLTSVAFFSLQDFQIMPIDKT